MNSITVRRAGRADFAVLLELFTRSVHGMASNAYTRIQLQRWAPIDADLPAWQARLAPLVTFVASVGDTPAGFVSLQPPSHVEMLFTDPEFARTGVATALYEHAVKTPWLRKRPLTADASCEARPFFEKRGWISTESETVVRGGVKLRRFKMQLQ